MFFRRFVESLYNNANLWCWIAPYPSNCENSSGDPGEVPCERGHNAWLFRWLIFYIPVWLIIIAVTVIMIMLTRSVKVEERRIIEMQKTIRARRPSIIQRTLDADNDDIPQPRIPTPAVLSETHRYERSRQIFHQAVFYLGVFYMTWLFLTVNRLYQLISGNSSNFVLLVLASLFGPLQGLMNFIVYRHGQLTT